MNYKKMNYKMNISVIKNGKYLLLLLFLTERNALTGLILIS